MVFMFIPCTALAAEKFEKGNTDTFWGVLYAESVSDDTLVRSINVKTDHLRDKGAVPLAKELALKLKEKPEGRRVLDITGFTYIRSEHMQNYFFLSDASIEQLRKDTDQLFSAMKDAGAELDYVIDDNESGILCYAIENVAIAHFRNDSESIQDSIAKNGHLYEEWIKNELKKVEQMPEYQKIRPELEAAGYVFGEDYDLEYINIFPGAQEPRRSRFYEEERPEGADTAFSIFNEVFNGSVFWRTYNEVVYKTIIKYYPDIKFSNYGKGDIGTGKIPVYNYQGTRSAPGVRGEPVGTSASTVNYGNFGMIADNPPKEYPYATMADTPFNHLLIEMIKNNNTIIGCAESDRGFMPWIGARTWVSKGQSAYHNHYNTDYYNEMILHFGMFNPDPFLIYNHGSTDPGDDMELLRHAFKELGEVAGFEDRENITPSLNAVPSWDQRYFLSGMKANGKGVWRITPDLYTPGVSMDNFLVNTIGGVNFRIGNQCIEFPEGSFIYEPEDKVSQYGYWVITPDATWPKEYRSLDYPIPDEPVDTPDHLPDGANQESSETMPDPNNYLKPIIEAESAPSKPTAPVDTENKEDSSSATQAPETPVATTKLVLNPIVGKGGKVPLFSGAMPQDAKGHWAENSFANMMALGVMQGTDIGMEPDRMINKAEFLAMLMRVLGVKTTEYAGGYSDVSADKWYADIVSTAAAGGWIAPENGSLLAPETNLTRAKMCNILVKAMSIETQGATSQFNDLYYLNNDAQNNINAVTALGLLEGYPDGSFRPNNICTRAEMAVIFERLMHVIPDLLGAK